MKTQETQKEESCRERDIAAIKVTAETIKHFLKSIEKFTEEEFISELIKDKSAEETLTIYKAYRKLSSDLWTSAQILKQSGIK